MIIEKILVPVDFSDYSKKALSYATDLALHFNAKIVIIYVVEPQIYPADFTMGQVAAPSINNELTEISQKELNLLVEKEIGERIPTEVLIKIGQPFQEINDTASELDVDLIVIATHGRSGFSKWAIGSVAEKILRSSCVPVLMVRAPGCIL